MKDFWLGFFRAADSRLAYDAWLAVSGFAIGLYVERQAWVWAANHGAMLVIWLVLSQRKQVRG